MLIFAVMEKEIGINGSRSGLDQRELGIEWLSLDEIIELERENPQKVDQLLQRVKIVHKIGGDGTLGCLADLLIKHEKADLPIMEWGGGRALTAVRASVREITHPDNGVCVVTHRPIRVESPELDQEIWTYLAGGGQLSVAASRNIEQLMRENPLMEIEKAYQTAGMASFKQVMAGSWVNPEHLRYQEKRNENWKELDGVRAVAAVVGLPFLGTFAFRGKPEELWLLEMGAGSRYQLVCKYGLVLAIGAYFPHGPDLLIWTRLVKRHEAAAVEILPDQQTDPNICLDGELRTLREKIRVTRASQSLTILIPTKLAARYNKKLRVS